MFLQSIIHYSLHILLPLIIALVFYKDNWKRVYVILLSTLLIDLDHLFADPIFVAERCSIGFHFLHSYFAIALYILFLFIKKTRVIAIGLLLHIITDLIDCFMSKSL
ncbi:MAG: hypothetical protein C0596_11455 [Marinilabiliales bacterium]|nr:MAG: hypothetical protein C0596_11455 [Marinilabiliales bacterium]